MQKQNTVSLHEMLYLKHESSEERSTGILSQANYNYAINSRPMQQNNQQQVSGPVNRGKRHPSFQTVKGQWEVHNIN